MKNRFVFSRSVYFTLLGAFFSAQLNAASIFFDDQTAATNYGFSAKADGFEDNSLKHFTKVNDKTFTILNKRVAGHYIPVNVSMSLQSVLDDDHPKKASFPEGSIGWSFDGTNAADPTYTFVVYAGGKYCYVDESSYQIHLSVDGVELHSTTTHPSTNWGRSLFHKVSFNKNSKITVKIIKVDEEEETVTCEQETDHYSNSND